MATWRKNKKARWTRTIKNARVWTRQEIAFLRRYYRFHDTPWVARQLGRTVYSVRYKASDLSIRKANPSQWKNPPKGKASFGYTKPTPQSRRNRGRRQVRWARTRRNNRRTRW